jgi:hypothetical protein
MKHALTNSPTWLLFIASILPFITGKYSLRLVPLAIAIAVIFLACWAYSITKRLSHKNSYDPKLKFTRFGQILFLATLFILLLCSYLSIPADESAGSQGVGSVFILGGFIGLYWFVFILKFIARSIVTLEQRKPVGFDQYAGYFFGLFFFPIGIWWVNPKIKALLK